MLARLFLVALASVSLVTAVSNHTWANTKHLFVFGDSYSTEGYNISAGLDSPLQLQWRSTRGPNWISYLRDTYNVTSTEVYNLAFPGATIDSDIVVPEDPVVQSIVTQVSLFREYLAPKPPLANWTSDASLFAFWVGINDLYLTYSWSNVTRSELHAKLMTRLFGQVDTLYQLGARDFLFLTIPPLERSPLYISMGDSGAAAIKALIDDYNTQLATAATAFQQKHTGGNKRVTVFDTQPIFNIYLDQAETFGYVNVTGYCETSSNDTTTAQIPGCAPTASYFWVDFLHPMFTVHNAIAKAIMTKLSGY